MKRICVLLVTSLTLISCEKIFFEPEPENNPEALFEEIWTTFNTDYAGFTERGVDWQLQYNIYRPQVNANTTEHELLVIIKHLLRTLNDGHVSLTTPLEKKVFSSNLIFDQKIDDELFNLDLIKTNYLNSIFQENGDGGNTYGIIDEIGYLHLAWISDNMLSINEILDHFSSTKGLIIDMRHNGGGDFTYAFSEFGRFTNTERFIFRSKTKNGIGEDDYTQWYNWNVSPSGNYFEKPIVLITDRYTISAGERTVMAFKTLPNLTHIGDTTNGAFSTLIGKELQNGWYYSVATQKIEFSDGKNYEGTGMIPDIYIKNKTVEIQAGIDKTLETALDEF